MTDLPSRNDILRFQNGDHEFCEARIAYWQDRAMQYRRDWRIALFLIFLLILGILTMLPYIAERPKQPHDDPVLRILK